MNCSLYTLDRTTHLKIVVMAAVAAALVVGVCKYSVLGGSALGLRAVSPHEVAPKGDREHPQAPAARPKAPRTEIA